MSGFRASKDRGSWVTMVPYLLVESVGKQAGVGGRGLKRMRLRQRVKQRGSVHQKVSMKRLTSSQCNTDRLNASMHGDTADWTLVPYPYRVFGVTVSDVEGCFPSIFQRD